MNTNIVKLNSFFDFFKFIADLDIDDKFNFYEFEREILEKLIKIIDKFILSDEFINKKFEIYQHNKKLEEKLITKTKEKRLKI